MPRIVGEITVNLRSGLQTKARQEELVGFTTCQNMDAFDTFRAIGKVPGSLRYSDNEPNNEGWHSLHYYEYYNLAGDFVRETLGLGTTVLYQIEADQSLTSLKTGLTAEPLGMVVDNYRAHFTSLTNTPFKYDGAIVTNWGVYAPGQTKTIHEAFSSVTGWTANGTNSVSLGDGFEGNAASVNKTDLTTSSVSITKTGYTLNLLSSGGSKGYALLYIPPGGISKLVTSGTAVSVTLGDTALSNANVYTKEIGEFLEGWNLIDFTLTSPDSTLGAGATLSTIQAIKLTIFLTASSTVQNDFRWDSLYTLDSSACTATAVAGTSINADTVAYKITFVSKYGVESNAGDASNSLILSGGNRDVDLSNIPISSDPQVVGRRIYRNKSGDATFRFIDQLYDNVTTTYTDTTNHSVRGSDTPPVAGGTIDNTPPAKMIAITQWQGYCFGINAERRYELDYSDPNSFETWPDENFRSFDVPLTALDPTISSLLVFTSDSIYQVGGGADGPRSFVFEKVHPSIGCVGPRAHCNVGGITLFWHDSGPYITHDGATNWFIGNAIKDQIDALDASEFKDMFLLHDVSRHRVLFFINSSTCWAYNYGTSDEGSIDPSGPGNDPLDPRTGRWSVVNFPDSFGVLSGAIIEDDADKPVPVIGATNGPTYILNTGSSWAVGSLTEAINAQIETTYYPMGAAPEQRGIARHLIVNAYGAAASTWTATVTTANDSNGEQEATYTTTFVVGPGHTSHKISLASGLYGAFVKVKLSNAVDGETAIFKNVRIGYIPRSSRGAR